MKKIFKKRRPWQHDRSPKHDRRINKYSLMLNDRNNKEETKDIQRKVEELLNKVYLKESVSPRVVLILFIPNKDGTWLICVDCRAINKITVKYLHPILRIGYHQNQMNPVHEWKVTFKTKFGLYE
uniref:Reverse transcriptase domain-containing protein n=1 Tax=Solanum lycopersicum TaxID=4081 RepID=A0A3Q7J7T4_SOLLC